MGLMCWVLWVGVLGFGSGLVPGSNDLVERFWAEPEHLKPAKLVKSNRNPKP